MWIIITIVLKKQLQISPLGFMTSSSLSVLGNEDCGKVIHKFILVSILIYSHRYLRDALISSQFFLK